MLKHASGHIQALLRHVESYSDLFRILCNPYMYKRVIFRTLVDLEPRHLQKTVMHVRGLEPCLSQNSIFRHFLGCLGIRIGGRPPLPSFENRQKVLWFAKKCLDCAHCWVKISVENVYLQYLEEKLQNVSLQCLFSFCFWWNVYGNALVPWNLVCPAKFFDSFLNTPLSLSLSFSLSLSLSR